jgi:hypothetical protein
MQRVRTEDIPRDQLAHFGHTVRQVPLFHAVGDAELDELLRKMKASCFNGRFQLTLQLTRQLTL